MQTFFMDHYYTQSKKKCTIHSLAFPVTQGQGQMTLAGSEEDRQNEIRYKVHPSTLFRKRHTTFHGVFLLRLSVL